MEEKLEGENPRVVMLDPFKIWKNLYFSTEEILTSTLRNYVTTDEFANGIDVVLNSYLQYLKIQKEFINRYMEDSPFSSKRDVARVAELVVSLENKVDGLEEEIENRFENLQNDVDFVSAAIAGKPEAAAGDGLRIDPSSAVLEDLSQRVAHLEKLLKKIDTNVATMNKLIKAEAKAQAGAPTVHPTQLRE